MDKQPLSSPCAAFAQILLDTTEIPSTRAAQQSLHPLCTSNTPCSGPPLTQHIPKNLTDRLHSLSTHSTGLQDLRAVQPLPHNTSLNPLICHVHPASLYIAYTHWLKTGEWGKTCLTWQKSLTAKSQLYPNYRPQFHTLSLKRYMQQKLFKNVIYINRS